MKGREGEREKERAGETGTESESGGENGRGAVATSDKQTS